MNKKDKFHAVKAGNIYLLTTACRINYKLSTHIYLMRNILRSAK